EKRSISPKVGSSFAARPSNEETRRRRTTCSAKSGIPIAVIEAKDNNYSVGAGMQQALEYAETLDLPFAYSSNGDAFLEHGRDGNSPRPVSLTRKAMGTIQQSQGLHASARSGNDTGLL